MHVTRQFKWDADCILFSENVTLLRNELLQQRVDISVVNFNFCFFKIKSRNGFS